MYSRTPRSRFLVSLLLLPLATAASLTAQGEVAAAEVAGGKVSIHYSKATLGDRSAEDLPVGSVWKMSAGNAALLRTSVPLVKGNLLLPPGAYRMSARRLTESRWELLLFQGANQYRKGMAAETNGLRLDAEEDALPDLTFTVKASRGAVRIKLHWGKHSLNTRFKSLGVETIAGTLGGKPAEYSFFGLKSAGRNQTRLSGGEQLTIGSVRQTTDHGISYSIHAQRQGEGVEILFKNASAASAKRALDSQRDLRKRLQTFLDGGAGGQVTRITRRLQDLDKQLVTLQARRTATMSMPDHIAFQGKFEELRSTAAILKVSGKNTDDGMRFDLSFGRKRAHFAVKSAAFVKRRKL